jgi:hypothetical protein
MNLVNSIRGEGIQAWIYLCRCGVSHGFIERDRLFMRRALRVVDWGKPAEEQLHQTTNQII